MNNQSWKDRLRDLSRQLFQLFLNNNSTESIETDQNTALQFIQHYHCRLTPQQMLSNFSQNPNIFPLKVRTAELILKQINVYYLPYRLESLLPYCDPFTAVATFLNALNFSYEQLICDQQKQAICQDIFKALMTIEEAHNLEATTINEFPLYEAATSHNLEQFQTTAFAFKQALDIIELLDQVQPRHYQKQQHQLRRFWHRKKTQELEQIVHQLTQ